MRGILREMMSRQKVSSEFQKMSVKYCEVLNYSATTYKFIESCLKCYCKNLPENLSFVVGM